MGDGEGVGEGKRKPKLMKAKECCGQQPSECVCVCVWERDVHSTVRVITGIVC